MEHVLRQCLIALRLAERAGLNGAERATVYYTALLINVGCHTDAYEQAKWVGDDIALKSGKYANTLGSARGALATLRLLGSGNAPFHRFRVGLEFALGGYRELDGMIASHAEMAAALAAELGLPATVVDALRGAYEQWNGRGWPGRLSGDDVPIAARIAQVSELLEVVQRVGGIEAARQVAAERSGTQFDPTLAAIVQDDADELLLELDSASNWDNVIDAEPVLAISLSGESVDHALAAVANFVDLKSPHFLGHSVAVAELAARAGAELGLSAAEVRDVRRAGLVHGLGRLGVSNSVWDKAGPLGPGEWERVRLHPHLTERMLHQSPTLARLGAIAVEHLERLDGSGYPRGLTGAAISPLARVVGAADAYQAMREPRPYRVARTADEAAAELRAEVRSGRLDADAVHAVLVAAGQARRRRPELPSGLTRRELEVLRLLARGFSNKQIATELIVSPKTVGTHVEHIYAKIRVSNRAAAAFYATTQGLLATSP
jgi:HD-GYP domain-containing protein (c-di-GMP phosphodiesterase class II)